MRNVPQRLANSAAPGALLKRPVVGRSPPRNRSPERDRDEAYLVMIRQLPCLHCTLEPCGEAAHVRRQSGVHNKRGGIGKKPADKWAVPLCHEHHMLQHSVGELQFWYELGIEPLLVCEKLYAKRDDFVAMRAVTFSAIAERESSSQFAGIKQIGSVTRE